jgi:hypothetical protein
MHSTTYRLAAIGTILATFAAIAGLAIPGLYTDAPNWVQQAQGTDLATLFLAVPVMAVGLWATARGSATGPMAVVAALLYLVYNYAIFAFSVAMNALTLVHIAILALCLWALLIGGRDVLVAGAGIADRLYTRTSAGLLLVVAFLFGLLWVAQVASASATGTLPPDLVKAGISTNPVYALDLAFFLPLCAVAGVALLRGTPLRGLAFSMLIWVSLMGAGVVGGFAMIAAAGDTEAVPIAVFVTVLSVASAIVAGAALAHGRPRPGRAFDPPIEATAR